VTDPNNLTLVGEFQDARLANVADIKIIGQTLYAASRNGDDIATINIGCDPAFVPFNSGADIGFDPEGANCLANDGGPFTLAGTYSTLASAHGVWSDNNYVYVAAAASGLHVFDYNGASFTLIDTYDTGGNAEAVWGDGTYIYVADNWLISVYTFDGSTLTQIDEISTGGYIAENIWGDGSYIYVVGQNTGVHAYSFDGTSIVPVASYVTSDARAAWGDGTYIYVADRGSGIRAFRFNGVAFTEIASYNTIAISYDVWSDGTYIYVADEWGGLTALTFDGYGFIEIASTSQFSLRIWGDGVYIYTIDSNTNDVLAYSFDGSSFTLINSNTSTTDVRDI
ncbi:MAG: hypothetical protein CUN55_15900, partial [Phototrophicales bacterium]